MSKLEELIETHEKRFRGKNRPAIKQTHCKWCYHSLEEHEKNEGVFRSQKSYIISYCKSCKRKCGGKLYRK